MATLFHLIGSAYPKENNNNNNNTYSNYITIIITLLQKTISPNFFRFISLFSVSMAGPNVSISFSYAGPLIS